MRYLILTSFAFLALAAPAVAHEQQVEMLPVLVTDLSSQEAANAVFEGRPVCVQYAATEAFCYIRFSRNGFKDWHTHIYLVQVSETFLRAEDGDNDISVETLYEALRDMPPTASFETSLQE